MKKSKPKPTRKPAPKRRPVAKIAPGPAPAPQSVQLVIRDPHQIMPTETVSLPVPRSVNDETQMIYGIGVDQIDILPKEEEVLSEGIDEKLIRWKPQKAGKPPIPFISWTGYMQWMNRAFGRTGWRMVPAGKPIKGPGNSVLQPHVLFIKGKAYATAWGEQDYFENNAQQTYGDAVESTRASALRRCMKQLGVGIELWDKEYVDALRRRHHKTGGHAQDEQGHQSEHQQRPPAQARTGDEKQPISDGQRKRLFVIAKKAGRTQPDVKTYLKAWYGIDSTKDIMRANYEAICAAMEKRGPLPEKEKVHIPEILSADDIRFGLDDRR